METWLLQQGEVRHRRTEQNSYDVARGVDRYVCLLYLLLLLVMVHLVYCVYWCLLVMERWNTMQYIPVHGSGHGDELLLFVKCSEIPRDCPTQRPGNKDSVCEDYSLLKYQCTFLYYWSSVSCRAVQCATVWKTRCSGLGLLHAVTEDASEKQGLHRWSFGIWLGCALWQCRIGFFSLLLTTDLC